MTLHLEHCMGTVFSIDIRTPGTWTAAIDAVVDWLHFVDAAFSTYRDDSDISKMRRGELQLADANSYVGEVLERCALAQEVTGGFFTAFPDGRLDPTGLVKGWAIECASALLRQHGASDHAVNGGGDVQLSGEAAPGRSWRVGISDPHERGRVLGVVSGRDLAVATSGIAERGRHIVDPFTGQPARGLASVTIVGPELTDVDAYATAAFAMGAGALDWVESLDTYEAMVVSGDGTSRWTSGWAGLGTVPGSQPTSSQSAHGDQLTARR